MNFSPWYSGHHALLIGVQQYKYQDEQVLPKIHAPENNVKYLERELAKIGFQCISLLSPTTDEYRKAKDEFTRHNTDDRLLIYYSGHGHQPSSTKKRLVYLTFKDTEFDQDKKLLPSTAIKIDDFCDVQEFDSKHILFILDCCYAGAGFLTSPSVAIGGAEVWLKHRCRCVIAACTEEQVARDVFRGSDRTVFTESIANSIKVAYSNERILTASELANEVRNTVIKIYQGDQTPVYRVLHGSDTAGEYLMTLPPENEELASKLIELLRLPQDEFQGIIDSLTAQEKDNLLRLVELARSKKSPVSYVFNVNGIQVEFILIPKGGFMFGSLMEGWPLDERVKAFFQEGEYPIVDKDAQNNEIPLSLEYLEDFWIMTTPVTEELILLYCTETQENLPTYWHNQPELPVVSYTRKEAVNFAKWLQTKLDLSQFSGAKITLPSEKEWEKAARGVKTTVYPWGNLPSECANVRDLGPGRLTPVKGGINSNWKQTNYWPREQENPFRLIDMIGNVWEICRTNWSDNHLSNHGQLPVIKGGSFENDIHDCRISTRRPMTRPLGNIGFRLVISSEA